MNADAVSDTRRLAELVRRHDRERYLTALFAPADRRGALMALLAFNYEIARAREVVTEPMLGRIRLQWWREGIEAAYGGGPVRPHEVLTPLAAAVRDFELTRAGLEGMIDARERDMEPEPPATLAELETYCERTSGVLQSLVLEILGERGERPREAARAAGIAYALIGLVRVVPFHAGGKRQYIPRELSEATGLNHRDLLELRPSPALAQIAERLSARAAEHLKRARAFRAEMPSAALPALLPARLAASHIRRLKRARFNVFDPRVGRPNPGAAAMLTVAMLTRRY